MRFRTTLFLGICTLAVIPTALLVGYGVYDAQRRISAIDATQLHFNQRLAENISERLFVAQHLMRISSQSAADLLRDGLNSESQKQLFDTLKTIIGTTQLIQSIHIDDTSSQTLVHYPTLSAEQIAAEHHPNGGRQHIKALYLAPGEVHSTQLYFGVGAAEGPTISLYTPIDIDTPNGSKRLGLVSGDLNLAGIGDRLMQKLPSGISFAIFDRAGQCIYPKPSVLWPNNAIWPDAKSVVEMPNPLNTQPSSVSTVTLPEEFGAWRVVIFGDPKQRHQEILDIWRVYGTLIALILLLGGIFSSWLSKKLSLAVQQLTHFVKTDTATPSPSDVVVFPQELRMVQEALIHSNLQAQKKQSQLEALNHVLESEVNARTESIRRQHVLLQNLFDGMTQGFLVVDNSGNLLRENARARILLGVSKDLAKLLTAPLTERPSGAIVRLESGAHIEVRAFPVKLRDREDEVTAYLFNDVSEREAMALLRQRLIELANQNIQLPIHAIEQQLIALAETSSPMDKKAVLSLQQAFHDLVQRLTTWLDLARVRNNSLSINRQLGSIQSVIMSAIQKSASQYPAQMIDISIPHAIDPVAIDAERLEQFFVNLFKHTAQSTSEGTQNHIHIQATSFTEYNTPWIRLTLESKIPILTQEQFKHFNQPLDQIQEKFWQDLSLFNLEYLIGQAIVQKHNGRIDLRTLENGKVVLIIEFPRFKREDSSPIF